MTDKEIIELFISRDALQVQLREAEVREMDLNDKLSIVSRVIGDLLIQEETNPQSSKSIIKELSNLHRRIQQ